jgi:hypothetical protein
MEALEKCGLTKLFLRPLSISKQLLVSAKHIQLQLVVDRNGKAWFDNVTWRKSLTRKRNAGQHGSDSKSRTCSCNREV